MKTARFLSVTLGYFFALVTCPSLGQGTQKSPVRPSDYHLWGSTWPVGVSGKGNWVSFVVNYDSGRDTLFVKNTRDKTSYSFPKTYDCRFGGERWFTARSNDTLHIQDLTTGRRQILPNISADLFGKAGRFHLLFQRSATGYVLIIKENDKIIRTVPDIQDWKLDEQQDALLYTVAKANHCDIVVIYLSKGIKINTIAKGQNRCYNLAWSPDGKSVAWIGQRADTIRLHHYDIRNGRMSSIDPTVFPGIKPRQTLALEDLRISPDNSRVLFRLNEPPKIPTDPGAVQVWDTNDKLLQSFTATFGGYMHYRGTACWTVATGKVIPITDDEFPNCLVNTSFTYAILFDPLQYEPQSKEFADRDLWALNLVTGTKRKIIDRHRGGGQSTLLSPGGRYLLYERKDSWWLYDFSNDNHVCISSGIREPLFRKLNGTSARSHFGSPAFSVGDKSVIITDEYDLWELSVDGKKQRRLTNGRDKKIKYRLVTQQLQGERTASDFGSYCGILDIHSPILLEKSFPDGSNAIVEWQDGTPESVWAYGQNNFSSTMRIQEGGGYITTITNFQTPPAFAMISANGSKIFHQSNPHYVKYDLGRAELVGYTVDGSPAKGILYYPAGYDKSRKYPMIVHIYEIQSGDFHEYINPTLYNRDGFNISNFIAQGYFVFLPDIYYTEGDPAGSALRWVTAATDAAIATANIDASRVALIGHSFGGYETMAIITQTDRFATAISGAGISDLIRQYFSVGGGDKKPEFFRTESQQGRLGKSFFEDKEVYIRNSPIYFAEEISTPFLLWSGSADSTVDATQTIAMHMAMRRLGKQNMMLLYPNEEHAIGNKKNMEDLTQKIEQWLAHYLKGEAMPDWK